MKDFYSILGVKPEATDDEIKRTFRRLARQYHPDANPGDAAAEARFKALSEAYDVLGDPPKRQEYDAMRANPFMHGAGAGRPGGPAGGFGGNFSGFDDLFGSLFKNRASKGEDLEIDTEIDLADVLTGTQVTLNVMPPGGARKRLAVSIPKGIASGMKVRVSGEGEPGAFGGPPGDLMVRVTVREHPRFRREGSDLHLELPVPVFDAVLGGEAMVPTLEGTVKLKLPPGTQGGRVFRLKNQGLPALKGQTRGALLVTVQLRVPEHVDDAARMHWQALAELEKARSL